MGDCQVCSGDDRMSYTCNECGGTFCSAHRLPENHTCGGLQTTIDLNKNTTFRSTSGASDSTTANASLIWFPVGVVIIAFKYVFGFFRWLFSPKGLKLAIVCAFCVISVSLTVGTGISQIDTLTEDAASPVAKLINSTADTDAEPSSTSFGGLNESNIELAVHDRVNEERKKKGLGQLKYDEDLSLIAGYHSDQMNKQDFTEHTSPNGETMKDRYEKFDYSCRIARGDGYYQGGGENIFYTAYSGHSRTAQEIADAAVEGWMESPGHRKNLLDENWNREGIGVNVSSDGEGGTEVRITQNFC